MLAAQVDRPDVGGVCEQAALIGPTGFPAPAPPQPVDHLEGLVEPLVLLFTGRQLLPALAKASGS
jgi:hypothetical protein